MVHGTQNDRLEPSVSTQKSVWKTIDRVQSYWQKCIWVVQIFLLQENGTQKNVHIFKSNAPILLKLGVGLDHMYAKGWIFGSLCVMSLWNTTTCKIFVTKVT